MNSSRPNRQPRLHDSEKIYVAGSRDSFVEEGKSESETAHIFRLRVPGGWLYYDWAGSSVTFSQFIPDSSPIKTGR